MIGIILREVQEWEERMQRESANSTYGRPLPYSNTPRGTMGFQWSGIDRQSSYEIDSTSKNDEASVCTYSIYKPEIVQQLDQKGNPIIESNSMSLCQLQIGGIPMNIINPTIHDRIKYEFVVKFWIIAENISEEVFEMFYIEVPDSLVSIVCTKVKKGSTLANNFENLLPKD